MENRLCVVSIIVEDRASAAKINDLLHEFGGYIVGRMGLPYRERGVSVICVVIDAPGEVTSALSGKLGMLPGVTAKTMTSKTPRAPDATDRLTVKYTAGFCPGAHRKGEMEHEKTDRPCALARTCRLRPGRLRRIRQLVLRGRLAAQPPPAAASSSAAVEPTDIRIAGLKGPTSMGMVKLMEDAENGEAANNYTFTIAGSADEVTPKLIQGEFDIAAVPANLASVLYNNTEGAVKLLAINTLGVIYIVEKGDSVQSLADLPARPSMPPARVPPPSMRSTIS